MNPQRNGWTLNFRARWGSTGNGNAVLGWYDPAKLIHGYREQHEGGCVGWWRWEL